MERRRPAATAPGGGSFGPTVVAQPLRTSILRHYKQLNWPEHQTAIFSGVLCDLIQSGRLDWRTRPQLRFLTVASPGTRQAPEADMRIFLTALLATAVVAGTALETAHAQENSGLTGRKERGAQNTAQSQADKQRKNKAVDDAYKSAVTRIPDAKEKYDPWKNAR
jgi:hypothetical protein